MLAQHLSHIVVRVPKTLIHFSQKLMEIINFLVLLKLFYLFPWLQLGRHIILCCSSRSSTNYTLIYHQTHFYWLFLLRPCVSPTHPPPPPLPVIPTAKPVLEHCLLSARMLSSWPLLETQLTTLSSKVSLLTLTNWDDFFAPVSPNYSVSIIFHCICVCVL